MKIFTFLALISICLCTSTRATSYRKCLKKTDFTFIPSGTFRNDKKAVSVQAFLMLNHEVTNLEYREYIKQKYIAKGDAIGAQLALPDTTAWIVDTSEVNYASLKKHYFNNPSYNNYPVVNVSKENAEGYCVWLTEHMRIAFPKNTFNDFRLPTKLEWIYAAKGGLSQNPYPWGGAYTRNIKGCYLANFNTKGEDNLTFDKNTKPKNVDKIKHKVEFMDGMAFGPVKVKTYIVNGYGIYNMAGNVAEMVSNSDIAMGGHWQSFGNDIQVTSEIAFTNANPYVGFRPIMSYMVQH